FYCRFLPCFVFDCYCDPRDLHSFPTRRSSDLEGDTLVVRLRREDGPSSWFRANRYAYFDLSGTVPDGIPVTLAVGSGDAWATGRSEEHTSELQSREISYAVFCLKKKKNTTLDC